jgi:hypothetical protein
MKNITIQVTDEEHKEIKMAATENGQSIKDYLLNSRQGGESYSLQDFKDGKPQADIKEASAISDTLREPKKPNSPETDPNQANRNWSGPMMRDQKKGKL